MRIASWMFVLAFVACGGSAPANSNGEVRAEVVPEAADPAAAEPEAEPTPQPAPAAEVEKKPSDKPPIYEERAITEGELDGLLAQAKAENKRVLLMFGGNWCGWCHKLHELMESDAKIGSTLEAGYIRVMVDSHNNDALASKLDIELKGVPFLAVLDPSGEVLVRQETGSLEDGPKHDPGRVLAFLVQWRPQA